jgi:hypothetical protein
MRKRQVKKPKFAPGERHRVIDLRGLRRAVGRRILVVYQQAGRFWLACAVVWGVCRRRAAPPEYTEDVAQGLCVFRGQHERIAHRRPGLACRELIDRRTGVSGSFLR